MACDRWCVTKCHAASPVPQEPRLPLKWKVNVTKCHACEAKRRWMSPSATPATQSRAAPRATQRAQARHQRCETKADVTKRHAAHAKRRWMSPSATPAAQSRATPRATQRPQARHQSQPSAPSATPATRNEGGCHQVPRLPRETKVDVTMCHACHAKWRCAPGDPARPSAPREPAQCSKRHACHAKPRRMSPSATPATQNGRASTLNQMRVKDYV